MIAGVGLFSMANLKQELIPSIDFPQSTVLTIAPGMSPELVDTLVSLPLSKALGTISGVEQVVANSSGSTSIVSVTYKFGTNPDKFNSAVDKALRGLDGTLPNDVKPQLLTSSVSDIPIMFIAASSNATVSELTARLEGVVVPEIEGVEGVGAVSVSGAASQRITITPDAGALAAAALSPLDISTLLTNNGLGVSAGHRRDPGRRCRGRPEE